MICPNCKTDNDNTAKYCRLCGKYLKSSPPPKKWTFFNILFWTSLVVSVYSFISIIYPIEHQDPGFDYYDMTDRTYYSDFLGINTNSGLTDHEDEWLPVVVISAIIAGLSFYIKNRSK